MLQPLRKEDGVRNGSLNNSTQLASVIKGREEEGNILFTISPLGKMSFPGRSESHTPVPVRIRTIYSHVLYEPRTTVGFCRNCVDQQVFGIKQLCLVVVYSVNTVNGPKQKTGAWETPPLPPWKASSSPQATSGSFWPKVEWEGGKRGVGVLQRLVLLGVRKRAGVEGVQVSLFFALFITFPYPLSAPEKSEKTWCHLFRRKRWAKEKTHYKIQLIFSLVHSLYLTAEPLSSPKADWLQKFQSASNKTSQNQKRQSWCFSNWNHNHTWKLTIQRQQLGAKEGPGGGGRPGLLFWGDSEEPLCSYTNQSKW